MNVILPDHLTNEIRTQGESVFPHECCGFLFGQEDERTRTFSEIRPAENSREENRERRFEITPQAFMQAERYAAQNNLALLGFYHSHPNHPAKPSEYDLAHAWPRYSYVIVSVMDGQSAELTSWILNEDRTAFINQPLS
jgi:proteasome lid subunit RPN8/RPN11